MDVYLPGPYDAVGVAAKLRAIPGVVEHGLFLAGAADETVVVLGDAEGATLHTLASLAGLMHEDIIKNASLY